MRLKFLYVPLFCCFLAACASTQQQAFDLWELPDKPVDVNQLLTGHFKGQVLQVQVVLSLNEDRLLLVGLDSMGRRAFSLRWDGQGIETSKAAWMPDELEAEYVLNDMMLIFWPLEKLSHLDVRSVGNKRLLWKQNKHVSTAYVVMNTSPWEGTYEIENHEFGYKLNIVSKVAGGE